MNRCTEDADSVPGLVPLEAARFRDQEARLRGRCGVGEGGVGAPEVIAETVGVTDLVVGSVAHVEHEVGVEVSEGRGALLNLRN